VPGDHCVTIFQDAVCKAPVTAFGNPPAAEGICIEVSTGTPQQSFTCVANTNCNN
jgi:ribosomal protein S12